MKSVLGFISTISGIAFILLLVRAGYGVIASDVQAGGGPPDFDGLVRPYLIWAAVALALSIVTHQFKKRI
ncbi:hypothetical protein [uncultured Tateyamaria sp.]|uniref:hypothetical protein n=1 Tax=uncultured Tateyamaria sp. TaxID=455651 RepID=UPI0026312B32|nr:hypothetical protein [uncultured Tateyamaria sp.]